MNFTRLDIKYKYDQQTKNLSIKSKDYFPEILSMVSFKRYIREDTLMLYPIVLLKAEIDNAFPDKTAIQVLQNPELIDKEIFHIIKKINLSGWCFTLFCCSGHGKRSYPYIIIGCANYLFEDLMSIASSEPKAKVEEHTFHKSPNFKFVYIGYNAVHKKTIQEARKSMERISYNITSYFD